MVLHPIRGCDVPRMAGRRRMEPLTGRRYATARKPSAVMSLHRRVMPDVLSPRINNFEHPHQFISRAVTNSNRLP